MPARKRRIRKRWIIVTAVALFAMVYGIVTLSPWPTVLFLRQIHAADAAKRNAALSSVSAPAVREIGGERYGAEPEEGIDLYLPPENTPVAGPLVVWVHGGAFVAGDRAEISGYLRVLAGRGHVVAAIGYRRAPEARYPTPVLQANAALAHLSRRADALGIDASRIVLAGDSAGAQIAAQLAAGLAEPGYAAAVGFDPAVPPERVVGTVLFAGIYDPALLAQSGWHGHLARMMLWSYFGQADPFGDPRTVQFSVGRHVTARFPPSFISAGNVDPMAAQSVALAETLKNWGVRVDTLFFAPDREPALGHAYQFDFASSAAREALDRMDAFLKGLK